MITKTLTIKQLIRSPKTDESDELNFDLGVNVLVGKPNTGKTQWLRMLNFLMGDRDSNAANAFNQTLVDKYDSVKGIFMIGDEEITLERYWKRAGDKSKIFINGEPITSDAFSSHLLTLLNIPILHYPQGNPFSSRTWPELSWPSLFRHIYRKQKSWMELASKQPEVDQHACILQFLGAAEYLFSSEYEQLTKKQKEILKKEVRKEEFTKTLNEISRELLNDQGLGVAITLSSIDTAIQKLDIEVEKLLNNRDKIVLELRDKALEKSSLEDSNTLKSLSEQWSKINSNKNEIISQIEISRVRLKDLIEYKTKIGDELSRVERAKSAGRIFRDLPVTHCPVCEQAVISKTKSDGSCYLCHQPTQSKIDDSKTSEQRIEFEIHQLQSENQEAQELITVVNEEFNSLLSQQKNIDDEFKKIQFNIRHTQSVASMILPPEISMIDIELGRIQESSKQLNKFKLILQTQESLSDNISEVDDEISELELEVTRLSKKIDFSKSSSFLVEKMNTYLNSIKSINSNSWTQGEIGLRLKDKNFSFTVGGSSISNLGSTMTLFFLASYNYALLSLSNKEEYHYPGISILDFPATFSDGSSRTDKENFILQPFIDLVEQKEMKNIQVIVMGSAFEGLQNVHRIELITEWESL
jgi:hypothetical protein